MKTVGFLNVMTAATIFVGLCVAGYHLVNSGQPSADVLAKSKQQTPRFNVADFAPGDVAIKAFNGLPILIWRRSPEDIALAAIQNNPADWTPPFSRILGDAEPVYADDSNLTLNGDWFIAVARSPRSSLAMFVPRAGNFEGIFEIRYATHYDLAGRARHQGTVNLTIIKAHMVENGKTIQLDMTRR